MTEIKCKVENGKVDVKFLGDHLNKRELLRLLKSIRLEYRRTIRLFRGQNLAEASRKRSEADELERENLERAKRIRGNLAKKSGDKNGKDRPTEQNAREQSAGKPARQSGQSAVASIIASGSTVKLPGRASGSAKQGTA